MSSGEITQTQFLKKSLFPYLEKAKSWISFFSISMQLTKLGRTKCVQEFHNWVCAIGKVILVPVKLSSLSGLWTRNGIWSRYWLLAWSFYQCNSRFQFIEVNCWNIWRLFDQSCSAAKLQIFTYKTGLLESFDFYFFTPKCEEWSQLRLYRRLLRSLHESIV